jgi:Malectin domain
MRTTIGFFLFLFLASLPAAAQTQQPIRVKCGGAAYTDSKHQNWAADSGNNGGLVSQLTGPISGTQDPALFQSGRMASDTGPLIYTFPVANGAYHLNLYFAELNPADDHAGGRMFNVKVQGSVVMPELDVFSLVGANAALIKSRDVAVSDGSLQIEFDNLPGHDRGKVTAIEITQTQPAPELSMKFVYPDGTPVSGMLSYTMATSVLKVGGSTPLVNGQASCVLFGAPQILGLAGQIQLNLSLVDSSGHTLWTIGMTLDPTSVNFGLIQSSSLDVIVQKT